MKKETLEGLFKKGLISEDTFNKGIQKFSDGGTVSNPIENTPAIPQSNPVAPVASDLGLKPQIVSQDQGRYMGPRADIPEAGFAGQAVQKDIEARQAYRNQFSPSPLMEEESNIASDIAKAATAGIGPEGMLKQEQVEPRAKLANDMIEVPKEKKVSPYQEIAKGYDESFAQMEKGITTEAEAGAKQAAAMTSAYQTAMNDLQKFQKEQNVFQQEQRNQLQQQAQKMEQSIDEFKKASVIDPNRFWANKTTGDKVMASIAIFMGGLGGGDNQALNIIDNAITRDIEAQKQAAVGAKGKVDLQNNIYQNMMNQFQNETAAFTASRLAALNIAEMQIKKATAGSASLEAKAKEQQALGALGLKKMELQKQLLNQVVNSPQALQADEQTRSIMRLPENMQKEAFQEAADLKKIDGLKTKLVSDYKEMFKLSEPGQYLKAPLATSSLKKLAKTKLFPAIKAIVDEKMTDSDAEIWLEPYEVKMTDSQKVADKKLQALQDALDVAASGKAPILKGFGIVKPIQRMSFKRNE